VVGSITMPHKRNPEASEHLVTLSRLVRAQHAVLLEGMIQEHERDGRGWKAEWVAFPEACLLTGAALAFARPLLDGLEVDEPAMRRNLEASGSAASERLLSALAPVLGKHRAQARPGAAHVRAPQWTGLEEAVLAAADVRDALDTTVLAEIRGDTGAPSRWSMRCSGAHRRLARPRTTTGRERPAPVPARGAADAAPTRPTARGCARRAADLGQARRPRRLRAGGNKARKLELLVADALGQGCDVLLTGGGPGSNHCQATAAAARVAGLGCRLVLYGEEPASPPANIRLARAFGAEVSFTGNLERSSVDRALEALTEGLRAGGRTPYAIPRGGATALGAAGYAFAAEELAAQLSEERVEPAAIVVANGSSGTQAGLVAGASALGIPWRIVGASTSRPPEESRRRVIELATGCAALIGAPPLIPEDVEVRDARGPGYRRASPAAAEAADLAASTEGLLLDPVFTAKAMATLIRLVRETPEAAVRVPPHGRVGLFDRANHSREKCMTRRSKSGSTEAPAPADRGGFALEIADAPFLHGAEPHSRTSWSCPSRRSYPRTRPGGCCLLLEIAEMPAESFPYDPALGDPTSRERFVVDRLGDDAGWLHAGRPRREAARVALRLGLRRRVGGLIADTVGFATATADLAERHAETLIPDQTYLQQAQPSTFGHYVLTFAFPALRDAERLRAGMEWVNRSPGGAGCVNGSRLSIPREREAELLGFGGVIEHTRDAMWQTDGLIDLLATGASLVSNMSKLAEDLEIWDSAEFDFVDLAGPYTRASVLMPQKRNPYALSIVRGAAGVLIGRLSGFLSVVKTPSARSDNLIFAYGEVPRALELARKVTRLMGGVVSTLAVNEADAGVAVMGSHRRPTSPVRDAGVWVDYRTAYRVVRTTVRRGGRGPCARRCRLDDRRGRGDTIGGSHSRIGPHEVLDPRSIVLTRSSAGGAAPEVVRGMAAGVRERAGVMLAEAERALAAVDEVEEALLKMAEARARG
jgi:argininosuccinate lyase